MSRRRAYRFGLRAEHAAALFLLAKGYRLIARRYRTRVGEIDLIVKRGRTIAFVEVKARPDLDLALAALGPEAERRISAAADWWTARHPDAGAYTRRFDLVCVVPWRLPYHLVNAFPAPG